MRQRGTRGLLGLRRQFKLYDTSGDNKLSTDEFSKALSSQRVETNNENQKILFDYFDVNRDGAIDYEEFLSVIRGELSPKRLELLRQIWSTLTESAEEEVSIEKIKKR